MSALTTDLDLKVPVIAAPMAGGASTPALVAAASRAGGLGFLAAGYKTPQALSDQIDAVRAEGVSFGVNVFAPNPVPVDVDAYRAYARAIQVEADRYGITLADGEPVEDDDYFEDKIDLLLASPVPVVSFTFGFPAPGVIKALRAAGSLVVLTVTSEAEAVLAVDAGADLLVVQSSAAGGHSGTLTPPAGSGRNTDHRTDRTNPSPHVGSAIGGRWTGDLRRRRCCLTCPSGRGSGRYCAAAHRGEWCLGSAQGSSGRHVPREHGRHKSFHGTSCTGASERVHRSLRRTSAHRVSGHPSPDQPDAQSRCCAGRSRANAPVGRYWLSPRDGGTSRGSAFAIG